MGDATTLETIMVERGERAKAQRPAGSAREEILGRVRAALVDVRPDPMPVRAPIMPVLSYEAVLDLFVERVVDYGATVQRCSLANLSETVASALLTYLPKQGQVAARVVVPKDLELDVPGALLDSADDGGFTAYELDSVDAVVTRVAVGIAETGTIVLDHGAGQGRRAISLVPDFHVCIIDAAQVVPDVPDAIVLLTAAVAAGRPLTWISGPSATSDIELDRVEGVHGPRRLHVVLTEPDV